MIIPKTRIITSALSSRRVALHGRLGATRMLISLAGRIYEKFKTAWYQFDLVLNLNLCDLLMKGQTTE